MTMAAPWWYYLMYWWLFVAAGCDALLCSPAIHRAKNSSVTIGRLTATLITLSMLALGCVGRLTLPVPMPTLNLISVIGMDIGLTLYALYLPERGLLQLVRQWRRR